MKDVSLIEAFCEVLSGIGILIAVLPALHLAGIIGVGDVMKYIVQNLTAAGFGSFLLCTYVVGAAVADPVGLALDECLCSFVRRHWANAAIWLWGVEVPSVIESTFWQKVTDHVLRYRERQWAYYSAYRNLFLSFVPASIFWALVAWCQWGWKNSLKVIVGFLILEVALLYSVKVLASLYARITNSVAAWPDRYGYS